MRIGNVCLLVLSVLIVFTTLSMAQNFSREHGFESYVNIPGATRAGSDMCANCHAEVGKNFQHAFHKQQGVECEDCHGNGSLHVEGGGDVNKIVSFTKRSARTADGACLGCHARDAQVRHWQSGSHAANHVRCIDCHQMHASALKAANEGQAGFDTSTRGALLAQEVSPETSIVLRSDSVTNEACLRCHQTQRAQLSMPYHHPLREGKINCSDCHDPHGGPGGNNLKMANVNELCLSCHAQYRGPFAYQHPPVSESCLLCHTSHGSANTNLLTVSMPALCLQCHAGHHNGEGTPVSDRCTNCHGSIHGTDIPTPSGGSRFVDKGPGDPALRGVRALATTPVARAAAVPLMPAHAPTPMAGIASGMMGMFSSGAPAPLSGGDPAGGGGTDPAAEAGAGYSAYSFTPGTYRLVDQSGFGGRVGEYDTLQQSAGGNFVSAYVSPDGQVTVVSRANVMTGDDYSVASQATVGHWLQAGISQRGFMQQQDHYPLNIATLSSDFVGFADDFIPAHATYGIKRRLGDAYVRMKVPKAPVHLWVKAGWQAHSGVSQLSYLDENSGPGECGTQCHAYSQFQPVNYTTRDIAGGADVDLGPVRLTYQHKYSSFNDRLTFPLGTYTSSFDPAAEGPGPISVLNPPPAGPAPALVPAGNYFLDIPAPSEYSADSVHLNWTASPRLTINGNADYTRLNDRYTGYRQNLFDSDADLSWRPVNRLRLNADYHQQNMLNDFTPYYTMYGNASYHRHWEGLKAEDELAAGFDVEASYRRSGITRSNASLWPQIYSIDNTDLMMVVPSSFSNTAGLALRYHHGVWSARTGYEWTGTHAPGYLTVPQSNNRLFADFTLAPAGWLTFTNDISIVAQNDFPAVPLLRSDSGLSSNFQRRNRFYFETANATLHIVTGWNVGLGYSYQQNSLNTYMAFQNDLAAGYVLDQSLVPFKQVTQVYWADTDYLAKKRLGLNLRLTYNSSRSGFRPDLNVNDWAQLGNPVAPDPATFAAALGNLQYASTTISQVIVPQWIGQSKVSYAFPRKFEGGLVFYYGSYSDALHPELNGVLRVFNVYAGRRW